MSGCAEVGRVLMLAWLLVPPCLCQVRHPLPVLWLLPGQQNQSAGVAPAVQLALQDLSRQPPPLGSYEITFELLDSQCDRAKGLKALFDAMWEGPRYLMVFGGGCPSVTALLARSLPALNLVQMHALYFSMFDRHLFISPNVHSLIYSFVQLTVCCLLPTLIFQLSFADVAPGLTDQVRYPHFFSMVPSDRAVNQAVVKLLQTYGWSRVGILTQEGPRLSEMKKDLVKQLMRVDIQVAATESLSENPHIHLKKLKDSDIRIIIGQFEDSSASDVFCSAYRLNLFGGRYQWIVAGGPRAGWRESPGSGWRESPGSGCSPDSLQTALEASIRLDVAHISDRNTRGVSGRTPEEYEEVYLRELSRDGTRASPLHGFAYDGVWVAAKALSRVVETARHREKVQSCSQMDSVGFLLNSDSFKVNSTLLYMKYSYQTTREVGVGQYDTYTQELRLFPNMVKFQGAGPARDRTLVLLEPRYISMVLYSVVSSATALTIIMTLITLFFIIRHRKHWLLRTSFQPLEELLLLGILLSCSWVLLCGLDGALLSDWVFDLLCSVRLWVLSVGHTVGFGVLFAKTWRVYSVFTRTNRGTKMEKSWLNHPGRIVAGMLLLDVFVLSCWQILDPLRRVVSEYSLESDPIGQDVTVRPYSEHCVSVNMDLWLILLCVYRGPLLGLGCFLSWSIRTKQEVHPAADRKHLTLSVFAVTASSSLGVLGSLLTSHDPPLQFCLTSLAVVSSSTLILACRFGPKVGYIRASASKAEQPSEDRCGDSEVRGPGEDATEDRCGDSEVRGPGEDATEDRCGDSEVRGPGEDATEDRCGDSEVRGPGEDATEDRCGDSEVRGPGEDATEDRCGDSEVRSPGDSRTVQQLTSENQQLTRYTAQLDVEIETITMQLNDLCDSSPDSTQPHMSTDQSNSKGEDRSQVSSRAELRHVAQVCCEERSSGVKPSRLEDVNSPEHVRRRLSVQLPILHHAYLPVTGGVTSSHSSLVTPETSVPQETQMTTSQADTGTQV
ncbi:gamma-aminobutyric acid type B receptor subunit 2-like [Polymixia lowei]